MDYGEPGGWERLVARLGRTHLPRPNLACDLITCEPDWSWSPRVTDHDAWLVLAGAGRVIIGDEAWSVGHGSLLLLRPGDHGSAEQEPTDRLTVIYCHFDFVSPQTGVPLGFPAEWLPSRYVDARGSMVIEDAMRRLVRLSHDSHPLITVERSAVLTQALLEAYRLDALAAGHPVASVDPRLQEVIGEVRSHPGRRLTVHEAAALAGLSTVHFSRLFSRDLGTSYRQFVLETRLDRARQLLTETSMSIGAIARSLGYESPYLFSRQIRRRYGLSPSQLRAGRTGPGDSCQDARVAGFVDSWADARVGMVRVEGLASGLALLVVIFSSRSVRAWISRWTAAGFSSV